MGTKQNKRIPNRQKSIVHTEGMVSREDLPLPYVHYPDMYGIFIGFASDENFEPMLCECSHTALINYLKIRKIYNEHNYPLFEQRSFPKRLEKYLIDSNADDFQGILFWENLCHKCNGKNPHYSYQHEMYGSRFSQDYGWYINQASLTMGLDLYSFNFLEDVCQEDVKEDALLAKTTSKELFEFQKMFEEFYNGLHGLGQTDYYNLLRQDQEQLKILNRNASRAKRAIKNKIENVIREEMGYKKIGESWTSETILVNIVKSLFVGHEVIHHYRTEWLNGLELDVFIPEVKIGFEYQGQQHFSPIEAWGGQSALEKTRARDKQKKILCERNGVRLIYINYFDPLSPEFVNSKLGQ